jgi:hypothetical protein
MTEDCANIVKSGSVLVCFASDYDLAPVQYSMKNNYQVAESVPPNKKLNGFYWPPLVRC